MSIRNALLDLRMIYGSFENVAKARNVDRDYLYRLFNGQRTNPSAEVLTKLGIKVTYSVNYKEHEEKI